MKNMVILRNPLVAGLFLLVLVFQNCTSSTSPVPSSNKSDFVETASGLKYKILREGNGEPVKVGEEILLHETMSYNNDSLLFDSRKVADPIKVLVGGNQVIKGLDEGLVGMKKGEIKKLIIPPALNKRNGIQTFPHPDSTLIYEVELVDILT